VRVKSASGMGYNRVVDDAGSLYLAIAHQQLGQTNETRALLRRADWLFDLLSRTQSSNTYRWQWWETMYYSHLRAEAETTINPRRN
jgi:hypothetical protein